MRSKSEAKNTKGTPKLIIRKKNPNQTHYRIQQINTFDLIVCSNGEITRVRGMYIYFKSSFVETRFKSNLNLQI